MSTWMNPVHPSADVHESATLGERSRVWHLAQLRENVVVGEECIIGRGAYLGPGVVLGSSCKIQNYAQIHEPAKLGDGVFVGPGAILTNDRFPRAVGPEGLLKKADDWVSSGVEVRSGASIGAAAVCIAPLIIGHWAIVGSGSVVTKDVPNFSVFVGNPARFLYWVGRAGHKLFAEGQGVWACSVTNEKYLETEFGLELSGS